MYSFLGANGLDMDAAAPDVLAVLIDLARGADHRDGTYGMAGGTQCELHLERAMAKPFTFLKLL
jgi:hypothetical protein